MAPWCSVIMCFHCDARRFYETSPLAWVATDKPNSQPVVCLHLYVLQLEMIWCKGLLFAHSVHRVSHIWSWKSLSNSRGHHLSLLIAEKLSSALFDAVWSYETAVRWKNRDYLLYLVVWSGLVLTCGLLLFLLHVQTYRCIWLVQSRTDAP